MLEKWLCHNCEKGFLVLEEDMKGINKIVCPFCGDGNEVENVAGQNPDVDLRSDMGCLWPKYNEFDKIGYVIRKVGLDEEESKKFLEVHKL